MFKENFYVRHDIIRDNTKRLLNVDEVTLHSQETNKNDHVREYQNQ